MEENRMKNHVTAVAIIQIIFGGFLLIGGLTIGLIFKFVQQFVTDPDGLMVLNIISVPISLLLFLFGGLMVLGAIGLLTYKTWGKTLTLIMGCLGLLNIPLGTLKGVYIIWTLTQDETNKLFVKNTAGEGTQQN